MQKEESKIFKKHIDHKGQLKYILRYKFPKEQLNGFVLIPKWLVGLGTIFSFAVLTILLASIIVIDNAPRAALYQEDCTGRSCNKYLGLICKNNTCDCRTGYIYINKCTIKRAYKEQCHLTTYCEDNKNLVCLNGVCSCNSSQYWNGKICLTLNTFGKTCTSSSQCNINQMLYCNQGNCVCNANR